ncbi:MAG TPA: DUF4232 domain-containing protein [Streptosporangiaceae bacterium]|nr:DUF4232 domain-containing protein [Streptosporangiaceae bacterium]
MVLGGAALLMAACSSSSTTPPAASGSGSVSSPPSATAATSAPATSAAASPQDAGLPLCATADLSIKLGASQGTAGSIYVPIVFTNTGTDSCTLYGYPGVSLAGGSPLAQIGAAAARSTTTPASLITLAPGAAANALLQYTEAGNYSPSTCTPTPATSLVIYPPGQTVSASVAYNTTGCGATSIDILHVGVVTAGSGG